MYTHKYTHAHTNMHTYTHTCSSEMRSSRTLSVLHMAVAHDNTH